MSLDFKKDWKKHEVNGTGLGEDIGSKDAKVETGTWELDKSAGTWKLDEDGSPIVEGVETEVSVPAGHQRLFNPEDK